VSSRCCAGRNGDGRLEVFARGADGALWHVWHERPDGNSWSGWARVGDRLLDGPEAIANQDGRLEVAGVLDTGRLRHWFQPLWFNGDLGTGGLIGTPGVGRSADGRLVVFARHLDGLVFHAWQTSPGAGWAELEDFGGLLNADVAVANNADGRLEIFARGLDNRLYHRWLTGSGGWSDWAPLGSQLVAAERPAVELNAARGLEVFARTPEGNIVHTWQMPSPPYWSAWESLGGPVSSAPTVVTNADGRLEVFARGADATLVHRWQTSDGWNRG
jgi:hypothetical protein